MKTTKKQFELFREECLRLQKEWGLLDWDLYFEHYKLDEYWAISKMKSAGRVSTIVLSSDLEGVDVTDELIISTAKHEMVHHLVADLSCLVCGAFYTKDEVKQAEESAVNRICKLIS